MLLMMVYLLTINTRVTFDYCLLFIVYVALSRLTSLEGLWLTDRAVKVKAHPSVLEFYGYDKDMPSTYASTYPQRGGGGSSSSSSSSSSAGVPSVSNDQRERMRLNREAAMARRREKMERKATTAKAEEAAQAQAQAKAQGAATESSFDPDVICNSSAVPREIESVFPTWRENVKFVLAQSDPGALTAALGGLQQMPRAGPQSDAALRFFETLVARQLRRIDGSNETAPEDASSASLPSASSSAPASASTDDGGGDGGGGLLLQGGVRVRVHGMVSATELNGQCGSVTFRAPVNPKSKSNTRWLVRVDGEATLKAIRPENMEVVRTFVCIASFLDDTSITISGAICTSMWLVTVPAAHALFILVHIIFLSLFF